MSIYSCEDKKFIEQFVSENSLDVFSIENKNKWQELGEKMNRNWEEIRYMCQSWKLQNNQSELESFVLENNEHDENQYQNLDHVIEQILSANEGDSCDEISYYVNNDGQLTRTDELECVVNDLIEPITGEIENHVKVSSEKRSRDIFEIEASSNKLVNTFEKQSHEELLMKREEHEEKMKIYKQNLLNGAELHKEKMKILKAKLQAIEEKIEIIDYVICNRNLKKKFKSGPI